MTRRVIYEKERKKGKRCNATVPSNISEAVTRERPITRATSKVEVGMRKNKKTAAPVGASDRTRTCKALRPIAPQAIAFANFATDAYMNDTINLWFEVAYSTTNRALQPVAPDMVSDSGIQHSPVQ